jgi:uncharacterized protein (DUF2236 family)
VPQHIWDAAQQALPQALAKIGKFYGVRSWPTNTLCTVADCKVIQRNAFQPKIAGWIHTCHCSKMVGRPQRFHNSNIYIYISNNP